MKFECPHCKQHLDAGLSLGGNQIQCPACHKDILIPEVVAPAPALQPERSHVPLQTPSVASVARGDQAVEGRPSVALRGAMTIPQFLASQKIQGGVQLDSSEDVPDQESEASAAAALLQGGAEERYEEAEVIGEGGMGVVVKARDRNLRCTVAMKVMREPQKASKEQVLRFIEEAQVTAQLAHPSIVPVHDLALDSRGDAYYTMKFAQGRTLKDVLHAIREGDAKTIEEYTLPRLLGIFQKVCDAIAFAHSRRVIHRDLKPENVMVGEYGEVLVMDWGLAKILPKRVLRRVRSKGSAVAQGAMADKSAVHSSPVIQQAPASVPDAAVESVRGELGRTMAGSIMGTPGYMAPEQAAGEIGKLDERTDIYSLGAILYTILTLRVSITGDTIQQVLTRIGTGQITPPTAFNVTTRSRKPTTQNTEPVSNDPETPVALTHCPGQRVPESLSAVAMKALATKQGDRYVEVKSLQREIENYQMGFATAAEGARLGKQVLLLVKRNKGVFTALMACLLVMVAGSAGFMLKVMASERSALKERDRAAMALAQFKAEQAQRQADRKASAPALVETAKTLIQNKAFPAALSALETAMEYDPELPDARVLAAALLYLQGKLDAALEHGRAYAALKPKDGLARRLVGICEIAAKKGVDAAPTGEFAELLLREGAPALAVEFTKSVEGKLPMYRRQIEKVWPGAGQSLAVNKEGKLCLRLSARNDVMDLRPLQGIPLAELYIDGTRVNDLAPLKGMPVTVLNLQNTKVSDLSPLAGMPLTLLNLYFTPVSDLAPLAGMPLTWLELSGTKITDLRPLKGLPLTWLNTGATRVRDLTPLAGMPLTWLHAGFTVVHDLTPLKGMPLTCLIIGATEVTDLSPLAGMQLTDFLFTPVKITKGIERVRNMKSLVTINQLPTADFWKKYDAGEFKAK